MTDPPDPDELARRYLDLWQEHWAALAADPRAAEGVARWLAALMPGAAWPGPPAGREPPAGAAAAGAPPGGGAVGLDELARRLADVERRLDRLEAARAPRKRASKR